jgi:predicted dehydrogenase
MWLGLPQVKLVGVADADASGLARTVKALGGIEGFRDYRKLLDDLRPEVVAIGMRHVDQHRDVAIAAIESKVRGIYIEKPFCRSPQEADEILVAARKHQVQLAIAHRNRYHPALPVMRRLIEEGAIGRVLEYRMRGKEDHRGGMLDLWVLGSHLMNLTHYFAGLPKSCSALVLVDGRPATLQDAVDGAEGIGRMAGNEIHARYEMQNGVTAYFDSIARAGTKAAGFGLQIIGTEGIIDLRIDREPLAHLRPGNPFQPDAAASRWIPISSRGIGQPEVIENLGHRVANHWLAGEDLVQSLAEARSPLCSAEEAAVTIEMITAVSTSHLQQGARIPWPLVSRTNPWG